MNYNEFIQNIIKTRGQWNSDVLNNQYEMHHIIPACLGGEGDFIDKNGRSGFLKGSKHINCIYLSYKEHYIAHELLALENKDNYSLIYAWHMISNFNKDKIISANEYEELKLKFIEAAKINNSGENNPMYNKNAYANKTEEELKLISHKKSIAVSGKNNPSFGKHWYNNGINQIYCEVCPDGYQPGTLFLGQNKNTHWYNNGIISKQFKENDVPAGFVLGRLEFQNKEQFKKAVAKSRIGKHHFTNGIDDVYTFDCPDGFWPGRSKGKKEKSVLDTRTSLIYKSKVNIMKQLNITRSQCDKLIKQNILQILS